MKRISRARQARMIQALADQQAASQNNGLENVAWAVALIVLGSIVWHLIASVLGS